MKIVIDIPKAYYESLRNPNDSKRSTKKWKTLISVVLGAVANGTPLNTGKEI